MVNKGLFMQRMSGFDSLRLFGAFLVLIGHSYVLTRHQAPLLFGIEIHILGVRLFFVVSGYLISSSYLRDPNLLRFAVRRALRIMPGLIAVVVLTTVAMAAVTAATPSEYALGALTYISRNVFLLPYHVLPGVFDTNPYPAAVNGSLWTLPVEVLMYTLTPVIVRVRPRVALLALAAVLLAIRVSGEFFGFGLEGAANLIPYFWIGAFARLASTTLTKQMAALAAAILLAASFVHLPAVVVAVAFAVVVLYVANLPLPVLSADLSFGLYLMAFPTQQLLILWGCRSPGSVMAASTAICLPLAWASWRFIERPSLALAKNSEFHKIMATRS